MSKKAELEQRLKERDSELEASRAKQAQLQQTLTDVCVAIQRSQGDLKRALEPVTLCQETGWELAERYEQSLKRARERLSALFQVLSSGHSLNFLDPLWQPIKGEDEQLAEYLQQSAESKGSDLTQ
jgi:hypothetical protein